MENIQHDSHQFYFERYLRNKMQATERATLEQRLQSDEELRTAFESYKKNRQQFMRELISEHTSNPYKSWISTFIYIGLAIAALILALNLYYENKTLMAERQQDKNLISRLLENIPFVGKKDKEKIKSPETIAPSKSHSNKTIITSETDSISEIKPNEVLLLKDTVLVPVMKSYVDQRFTFYRTEIDTTLSDQELFNLIYRNSSKYAEKYKTHAIGVEFWQNTEMGRGYKFNGHKLQMFGLPEGYKLLLVKDENELVWISADAEVILVADDQFHNY